jgi:hypothetical protein
LLSADSLAIVGSRNATPQGVTNAERFARAMSEAGLVIISGLALGIEAMSRSQLKVKPVAEMIMRPFSIELKQVEWQG